MTAVNNRQAMKTRAQVLDVTRNYAKKKEVSFGLEVNDKLVGDQFHGFDGAKEKPFVLVPSENAQGQVSWKKEDLKFSQTYKNGGGTYDSYAFTIPNATDKQLSAIQKYGVAFGMETNKGTIWAQQPGENTRPNFVNGNNSPLD